jgi:hypothetical protein
MARSARALVRLRIGVGARTCSSYRKERACQIAKRGAAAMNTRAVAS